MRRLPLALTVVALVGVTGTAAASFVPRAAATPSRPPRAGQPRVRVEVLNATKTVGLGRRAMLFLRDQGFDVVELGTSRTRMDSTIVLDRSGHPELAAEVSAVLGGVPVRARRDSSRYLDVTVLIGGSWRPPAEPFYP